MRVAWETADETAVTSAGSAMRVWSYRSKSPLRASAALVEQQRRVLRLVRYLTILAAVPVAGQGFVSRWQRGEPVRWIGLELAVAVLLGTVMMLERERNPRRAGACLFAGTLALTALALLDVGPGMGVGALFCTCALIYSFFLGGVAVPAIVVVATVLSVGILVYGQHVEVAWRIPGDAVSEWVRMVITLTVVVVTVTVAFDRLVSELEQAIGREQDARLRERRAQEEREASLAAAARSQRLEVVGRLAGGVAHDFNNALTVLAGGLQALQAVCGDEGDEVLRDMETAVRGATATTRQLLSLARQGSTLGEPALPSESVAAVARNLKRIFPENIQILIHVDTVPRVRLSSGEFEQAVLNLCLNARDAMPEGGTLTLRCARTSERPDAPVLVEVSDTGLGMSEETTARAAEPFFSTKPSGQGTGLGLAMVEQSVYRVGGRSEIDSNLGEGTTVRLEIPIVVAGSSHQLDVEPGRRRERARLLLLEDDPVVRRALFRTLRQAGHAVAEVDSIASALRAIDQNEYDLLITDGVLRDGSCSPVIARFRAGATRPVVVCSGYVPESGLLGEIEAGSVTFLAKPVLGAELLRAVDQSIQQLVGTTAAAGGTMPGR